MSDEKYDRWKDMSRRDMKSKLKNNIEKRRAVFQEAVNRGVVSLQQYIKKLEHGDDILPIVIVPLKVDKCYGNDAYNTMCSLLDQWPGVNIPQCKNKPQRFKEYWRISDNWWNRQKGKWFGDLFFYPLLKNVLQGYCGGTMSEKKSKSPSIYKIGHDLLFSFALYDIIHSEISFEKARPNPLIFDLALQKSGDLNKYFTSLGNDYNLPWNINAKTKTKFLRQSVRDWAREIKDKKCTILRHLGDYCNNNNNNNALLNVMPSITPYRASAIPYRIMNGNVVISAGGSPQQCNVLNAQSPPNEHIISRQTQIQAQRDYRRLQQQLQYQHQTHPQTTTNTNTNANPYHNINQRPPMGLPRPHPGPRRHNNNRRISHHNTSTSVLPTVPYNMSTQKLPPLPMPHAPYNYMYQHAPPPIPFMNYRPFPHQWDSQSSNPSIRSNVCPSHLSMDQSTFPTLSTPNTIGTAVEIDDVFSSKSSQPNPLPTPVPVNDDDHAIIRQISEEIDMEMDHHNSHYYANDNDNNNAMFMENVMPLTINTVQQPMNFDSMDNFGGNDELDFDQNIDDLLRNFNNNNHDNLNSNSQPNISMTPPAMNSASNNSNISFGIHSNLNSNNGMVMSGSPPDRLNLLLATPRLSDDDFINGRVSNSNSEMNPTQMSISNTFQGNISSGNEY